MRKSVKCAILLTCVLCMTYNLLSGQSGKQGKKDRYKVWISKMDKSKKTSGYIFDAGDSEITIMNYKINGGSQIIQAENINEIKLRKKGKPGNGLLKGALIGITLGAIIGFASNDDLTLSLFNLGSEQKAILLGSVLSIPGAFVGLIAGHQMSLKIPIKGSRSSYDAQLEKLRLYEVKFQ